MNLGAVPTKNLLQVQGGSNSRVKGYNGDETISLDKTEIKDR
jgi:hypothetical protein